MKKLSTRDKMVLAGLFLSKFNDVGVRSLGFGGFSEAFNALAFSLKGSPASLKNYRDEFDPYFPNTRKGWHKRSIRKYCKEALDEFGGLNLEAFTALIKTEVSLAGQIEIIQEHLDATEASSFAKRLVTGQAAEKYFERTCKFLPEFQNCDLTNTTGLGCGFDYKMVPEESPFLAVEVKGMSASTGEIQLTSKEHRAAELLKDRFFLFVVRNFAEKPFHTVFRNPLNSRLVFERREVATVQVSWSTCIGR
ncbi:MAG: protein NO VEIN domain-containing protein [Terriglobia bacterium]